MDQLNGKNKLNLYYAGLLPGLRASNLGGPYTEITKPLSSIF